MTGNTDFASLVQALQQSRSGGQMGQGGYAMMQPASGGMKQMGMTMPTSSKMQPAGGDDMSKKYMQALTAGQAADPNYSATDAAGDTIQSQMDEYANLASSCCA